MDTWEGIGNFRIAFSEDANCFSHNFWDFKGFISLKMAKIIASDSKISCQEKLIKN